MKNLKLIIFGLSFLTLISSCQLREDIGPIQESQKIFQVSNFDKLSMGDAFKIEVIQGTQFSVTASGDRRNLDDLIVEVFDEELRIRYNNNRNRQYQTQIFITMPTLTEVDFGGASDSEISGFDGITAFKMTLSGASESELNINADKLILVLSGASQLSAESETSQEILADLSGASTLNMFASATLSANLELSGASDAKVNVTNELEVKASGASIVRYRGTPSVSTDLSGASQVIQD